MLLSTLYKDYGTGLHCFKCSLFVELISGNWLLIGKQLPSDMELGEWFQKDVHVNVHDDSDTISNYDLQLYYK